MDFKDFLSNKVWVAIDFGPEGGPEDDPRRARFSIAYRPQAMSDADAEYIGQWDRARALDYKGLYDDPADETPEEPVANENRTDRRARERAESRQAATPQRERMKRPTYAEMLTRLMVDWDLTWGKDADGQDIPWPVTAENIQSIDYAIRLDMLTAIMNDYISRPNLTTLSKRYSAATTGNGQTTPMSSSSPDGSTAPVSPPGNSSDTRNGLAVLSGAIG